MSVMEMNVDEEKRGRGRSKKMWINGIEGDMKIDGAVCVQNVGRLCFMKM